MDILTKDGTPRPRPVNPLPRLRRWGGGHIGGG